MNQAIKDVPPRTVAFKSLDVAFFQASNCQRQFPTLNFAPRAMLRAFLFFNNPKTLNLRQKKISPIILVFLKDSPASILDVMLLVA